MRAERHIEHYNALNGKKISREKLQSFLTDLKKDIDAKRIDAHVPFGVECISICEKLTKTVGKLQKTEVVNVALTPIPMDRYKTPPVAKKLGDNETRKPTKPAPDPAKEKRQDIPTKRKQELDKKSRAGVTFKDLKGTNKIDLRKLRHYIDGYLQIEKEQKKLTEDLPAYGGGYTAAEVAAIHKKVDKFNDQLEIQVKGAAKALKISEQEFIGRVNNFTENGNSLKEQINGIKKKSATEAPQPRTDRTDKKRGVSGLPAAKLNGVLDASALAGMVFKVLELTGRFKTDFHKLYNDTLILIWGLPGSGKTVYLLEFAQYLASMLGLKVLYLANEEWGRSTLSEKINAFKIGHANLKLAKDLNSLKTSGYNLQDFDAVFMDSVQSLGFTLDTFKKFVEENPGRIYIPIVQSTKDGDFRGGKDWEHEVDVAGEIVNRKLILRKNRLDPDFEKKSSKLRIDNLVHEKKEQLRIKDMVNKGTTKAVPEKESKTVNV